MESNYKKLGGYIRQIDTRNSDARLGEDNLYGISVTKEFIVSHANLVGVTFDSYKVVAPRQFAYIPDTSRRGDKIAISLNTFGEDIIVSSICSVFEIIDEDELLPEYLMLWFMRPEFDRYARFMSNGSAREVFDWDSMCGVELPVPSLPEQRKIVHDYRVITDRIELLRKMNENLFVEMQTVFQDRYFDSGKYEDWSITTLDDITSKFTTGLNPRDNFVLGHGENHYVTIKNMNNNRVYLDDKCDFVTDEAIVRINQRSDLQAGDVLFSGIATIGRTYLIPEYDGKWNISESIFTIRPTKKVSSEFLLALLMSKQLQDYAEQLARGSAQRGVRMADLKAFILKMPDDGTLRDLTRVFKGFLNNINLNNKDEDCLLQLRDIVLNDLARGA